MSHLVMEINDLYSINNAKIELNKINVIGGVNGSGKSTASTLLYTFLKANSIKRRDLAVKWVIDEIDWTIKELNYEGNEYDLPEPFKAQKSGHWTTEINEYDLLEHIKRDDGYSNIINVYNRVYDISKRHIKLSNIKYMELSREFNNHVNDLIDKLEKAGIDVIDYFLKNVHEDLDESPVELKLDEKIRFEDYVDYDGHLKMIDLYCDADISFEDLNIYFDNLKRIIDIDFNNRLKEHFLRMLIIELLPIKVPNGILFSEYPFSDFELDNRILEYVEDLINIEKLSEMVSYFNQFTSDLSFHEYFSINDSLSIIFGEESSDLGKYLFNELALKREFHNLDFQKKVGFHITAINSNIDAFEHFFKNGLIDSFCYVDNVSIFDFGSLHDGQHLVFHMNEFYKNLLHDAKLIKGEDKLILIEPELDRNVENIIGKIEDIIKKKYSDSTGLFLQNIDSSGTKQIAIIQLLLSNNKLKKDGFLLIDEPEVNLHPDWQFKFAEILVLLAKDLNITVYLNSHSPFFIESIDAFTEYYDMQDDINYYLTEESENEGKYDFTRINSDELYKIYDNLGDAYKLIDQLRIRKRLDR